MNNDLLDMNSAPDKNAEVVDQLLSIFGDGNAASGPEQRNRDRFPIFCCMEMMQVDQLGKPLSDEVTTVVGKDLSTTGISFSHDYELKGRRIILSLDLPNAPQLRVEAEVTWTRRTPIGLYESGCRLIRKVTPAVKLK